MEKSERWFEALLTPFFNSPCATAQLSEIIQGEQMYNISLTHREFDGGYLLQVMNRIKRGAWNMTFTPPKQKMGQDPHRRGADDEFLSESIHTQQRRWQTKITPDVSLSQHG